jgi:hypothetical protein
MLIYTATGVAAAAVGDTYTITTAASESTVAQGQRIVTVVTANGASPKFCVFLQHSPDSVSWADINCDWVLPMGATARAYAKGTTATNTRDIHKTTGTASDGVCCASVYLGAGYVRAVVAADTTPGTEDIAVHVN